jgi:16S rRNA (uracil1498-N3)-methyltransferase
LQAGSSEGAVGLLLEPNADGPLSEARLSNRRSVLVVGPEGGLDEDELTLARRLGYRTYRLGPRILRTETAGLAALAVLQAIAGDFR